MALSETSYHIFTWIPALSVPRVRSYTNTLADSPVFLAGVPWSGVCPMICVAQQSTAPCRVLSTLISLPVEIAREDPEETRYQRPKEAKPAAHGGIGQNIHQLWPQRSGQARPQEIMPLDWCVYSLFGCGSMEGSRAMTYLGINKNIIFHVIRLCLLLPCYWSCP